MRTYERPTLIRVGSFKLTGLSGRGIKDVVARGNLL
jgi:hypothetical protein